MPRPDPRSSELIALAEAEPLPPDAMARAAEAISCDAAEVRAAALDAIGRMVTLRGVAVGGRIAERIVRCTGDEAPRVRAEAAATLAMLEEAPPGAAEAIRRLLEDEHSGVRQEACAALGDLGDAAAADGLAARLEDQDPAVGFEAAFALASLEDSRARPLLEEALGSTRTRLDACEGLRRLGDRDAVPALERLAKKRFAAWVDRLTSHATLFALGETWAADAILGRTGARNREERAYALSLIGSHKITAGRETLEAVALDPKDRLRETAVRALGTLEDPAAIPTLEQVLDEGDPHLAREAEEALQRLPRT